MKITYTILLATAAVILLITVPAAIAGADHGTTAAAMWHLDEGEGATAADSSGNDNHGALTNMDTAVCWVGGKYGNALKFDGVDDYIDFGSDDSLKLTDALTVTLWVKRTDKTTFERFLSHSIGPDTYAYEVGVDYTEPEKWRLRLNSDDITLKVAMAGEAGQWIHVAYVYDRNLPKDNMKIYEDGVLVAAGDYDQPLTNHGKLLTNRQGKTDGWLKSTIDEVCIWPRALSAEEIAALSGALTPLSRFKIDQAIINFNNPGDDRAQVDGELRLDLAHGDGVNISEDVTVRVGTFSETITMTKNWGMNRQWTYRRPPHGTGGLKDMTINWRRGTFDFNIDNTDFSEMDCPDYVTISLQIGDDFGEANIAMKETRQWSYKSRGH